MNEDKPSRWFKVGETVYVRNFGKGKKWIPGEVAEAEGARLYKVKLETGELVRRHD